MLPCARVASLSIAHRPPPTPSTYFNPSAGFRPTGGGLCTPAFVGMSVFFKPLALPITYCVMVASDTSGRVLMHTPMTETLTFAIQVTGICWLVAVGALSVPLVFFAFPCFGLVFSALYFYYQYVFLPRLWSADTGMYYYKEDKKVLLSQWDCLLRYRKQGILKEWNRLGSEDRSELLRAEQLGTVLLLRSTPFALCFGISLWKIYITQDYLAELSKMGTVLAGIIPMVNIHELLEAIRWPSELTLPSQIPLAVSVGALVAENAPIIWRALAPIISGTTATGQAAFIGRKAAFIRQKSVALDVDGDRGRPAHGPAGAAVLRGAKATKTTATKVVV